MRTLTRILGLAPLAIAALTMSMPLSASAQTVVNEIRPFSWPQFKSDYGLPSTPTTGNDSSQTDGTTNTSTTFPVLSPGAQQRAYLLGNYGTILPPTGYNNYLDLEAGTGTAGVDALEDWAAPFYGNSASSAANIIVDDDNTQDFFTIYNPSNVATYDISGAFFETAAWTTIGLNGAAIPIGTSNYYGDSYQTTPAVNRELADSQQLPSATFAAWVPYVTTPGYYSVYAYFPSQNLTAATPEPHVDDARYTVYIKLAGEALVSYQVTVDQKSGGVWVPIGKPYYFPATTQYFNSTTGALTSYPPVTGSGINDSFAEVRVDNTTTDSLTNNPVVVADAIELRANDGVSTRSFGTPTAVNITAPILASGSYPSGAPAIPGEDGSVGDYSEIALGYGGGSTTIPDGSPGGLPIGYITDTVSGSGATASAVPTPAYFNGSVGYNSGLPSSTIPIDQVVYFTRTETVNSDPNNPAQSTSVGYLYAVNGQTGDVIWRFPSTTPTAIGDTDTTNFSTSGFVGDQTTNSTSSYDSEAYSVAPAVVGGTSTATWKMPSTLASGNYFVYVWFPNQSTGEQHITDASYTVNDGLGLPTSAHVCNAVNQQTGGTWVQLSSTVSGATTEEFDLNPSSANVTLSNASATTGPNLYAVADAVEFVPAISMGTSDSTPAVVRNMRVWDTVKKQYVTRTVVIAADNNGKVYCVDAAGNEDGNDTLYDANNVAAYINSSGTAYTSAAYTTLSTLPLHPEQYGSTHLYWIWQPNTAEPISTPEIIDETNPSPSTVQKTSAWSAGPASTNLYDDDDFIAPAVARTTNPPTDYVTYSPNITTGLQGAAHVFVWNPGTLGTTETHIDDAEYTIVDDLGVKHICKVDQQTGPGTGGAAGFEELEDSNGETTFDFDTQANTNVTGYASTVDTIVLDNTTSDAVVSQTVDADAIELVFSAGAGPNSSLIAPLAFGTCSPTVHVTKVLQTGTNIPMTTVSGLITYDQYNAKIYIGNSNGVLYALDGAGNDDGVDPFQRDFSQDPATPSPSVDWWFNVGVTAVDGYGNIIDQQDYITESIAGTPAYYHNPNNTTSEYDQILFTTFEPSHDNNEDTNSGTLYSVNAIGPVGDYGTGTPPDASTVTDYRTVAGTNNYNLSPIPYFSFPDAYGELHLPNETAITTLTSAEHLVTSLVPASNGIVPPAHALGNAAGSPSVYNGGVTVDDPITNSSRVLPPDVYFAANDPTTDGSQPSLGRIWGVDLTTGTVDEVNNVVSSPPYIYPLINPNPGATADTLDPNTIPLNDQTDIPAMFVTQNTSTNTNTLTFGPFTDGPITETNSSVQYYVSSSPAIGIVHTIPTGAGFLTDTLIGGDGYAAEYGGDPYDKDVPMLYVGDLNGTLHSINLAGTTDDSRFIQDAKLDGTPIISTPALLANGNGPDIASASANNVGGVVFATTQSGSLWESEAFPFIENNLTTTTGASSSLARNVDFEYGGPGGFSSVAAASFNIDNFDFALDQATYSSVSADGTASVDTSEWVYASGDNGFTYGLTPDNTAFGNGGPGGFDPGEYISPTDIPPSPTIPLNRNFFTAVLSAPPTNTSFPTAGPNSGLPPNNPMFDWGQTAYIVFYGLDDPNAGSTAGTAPTQDYPKALTLTFSTGPRATVNNSGPSVLSKTIDLTATGATFKITGNWPPAGYALTDPSGAQDPSTPAVGAFGAVYAYQLSNGETGDPQTPGSSIEISNIKEQVQYYAGTAPNYALVTTTIAGRSNGGTVIREANSSGTPPFTDVVEPGVDEATFSILNPLAIRGAGRSMGTNTSGDYLFYNLTLSSGSTPLQNELGPFSGVPSSGAAFSVVQSALTNGNSVPETMPLGGTETNSNGTIINSNDPSNSAQNNLNAVPTIPIVVAVAPGPISHGTSGNSATYDQSGTDPTPSTYGDTAATSPSTPTVSNCGDYGESLLDIADRSDLGDIDLPISTLTMKSEELAWNDNSSSGGALSVINPLNWETMPRAKNPVSSGTLDYPNIAASSTQVELLPRTSGYNSNVAPYGGSDSTLTSGTGTLAIASPTQTTGHPETREIYPNAAMVRVQVPKYQSANLESYDAQDHPGIMVTGDTRLNSNWYNVAQGYIGSYRVTVSSRAANSPNQQAYRRVQIWVSVPVDTSTAISEPTIDIGTVPAGFGIDLNSTSSNTTDNTFWTPFNGPTNYNASNALSPYYKPITIVNNGNVNLINLHLNQYNYLYGSTGGTLVPNALGSYEVSGLSTIPTYDVAPGAATVGLLTGTPYLPIVRSSIDTYPVATFNANQPSFDAYQSNTGEPFQNSSLPGAALHKPRVGDLTGTVASVPDVPHNNLPNTPGNEPVSTYAYTGRPVVSVAIPMGTPAGTYTQSLSAFEGFDSTSNAFQGLIYNGAIYTNNGWVSVPGEPANGYDMALDINQSTDTPVQTLSNPSTTLTVTVAEDRLTDGVPMTTTTQTGTYDPVLPMIDSSSTVPNSNDLQPWGYTISGYAGSSTFGLLWTSARAASATAPTTPYSIWFSSLSGFAGFLNTPNTYSSSPGSAKWWTKAVQETETGGSIPPGALTQQSYGASTYSTGTGYGSQTYALWVTEVTDANNTSVYSLNEENIQQYTGNQSFTSPTVLFSSTQPIFSPRATSSTQLNFDLPSGQAGLPTTSGSATPGTYPLIVYYTKVGGRSTLMYWPAVSTVYNSSGTASYTITSAAVPLPNGIVSASTPNVVYRPPLAVNGGQVQQADIVFSGSVGSSKSADILTARYSVTTNNAGYGAVLTPTPTLPIPTSGAIPTQTDQLLVTADPSTWQARDINWYRSPSAFGLSLQVYSPSQASSSLIPLIVTGASTPTYDHASGQWIFVINWNELITNNPSLPVLQLAQWWTGSATPPNILAYVNPNTGTVRFSTPLQTSATIPPGTTGSSALQFQSLLVNIDPMVTRNTFESQSNTEPISFIDDTYKPNAAPGQSNIETSRYWYIYRKQTLSANANAAATSVLYFNTRRLTIVLPYPVQLTDNAGTYTVTNLTVTGLGSNVTNSVDIDWARGRIYFPETINNISTEGQSFTVNYTYQTSVNGTPMSGTEQIVGVVTWQDEPLVNSPTQMSSAGEHVVPNSTPANESNPSAFLDPNAGASEAGAGLIDDPATVTPASLNGQPYAHKVWVFWTSTRNAAENGGTGSDIYWETIDPRFEVINP